MWPPGLSRSLYIVDKPSINFNILSVFWDLNKVRVLITKLGERSGVAIPNLSPSERRNRRHEVRCLYMMEMIGVLWWRYGVNMMELVASSCFLKSSPILFLKVLFNLLHLEQSRLKSLLGKDVGLNSRVCCSGCWHFCDWQIKLHIRTQCNYMPVKQNFEFSWTGLSRGLLSMRTHVLGN